MEQDSKEQVPVLHVRGTHYAVGHSIGKTFKSFINNYVDTMKYLNEVVLPIYSSEKGRQIYDRSLELCQRKYPQYIKEMQGMADGAEIPFHKILLLHLETMIAPEESVAKAAGAAPNQGPVSETSLLGCSDILCNHEDIILAHTEDAPPSMVNQFFIVSAHVVDQAGTTLEKFSTLTWPGYLPGYTMGFNHHGIVYSVNTICPIVTYADRTPVTIITRALLAARNEEEVMDIIKDAGTGIADGFSLNLVFVKDPQKKDNEEVVACNIEIGPNRSNGDESEINVYWVKKGSSYVHCNKYLRLDIPVQENRLESTNRRHKAIAKANPPNSLANIKTIVSDRSDSDFPVFRSAKPGQSATNPSTGAKRDTAATIAVGVFDIRKKRWLLYTKPPIESEPVVELPLVFDF